MHQADWDCLVSDLYLSAADPEAASRLPGQLAASTGGTMASCWLMRPDSGAMIGVPATNFPAEAVEAYRQHHYQHDPWRSAIAIAPADAVLRTGDVIDAADLARSAYYNEFASRYDLFHMIGAMTRLGVGDTAAIGVVSILRSRRSGAFEADAVATVERLLPHLAGAFRLREQVAASSGVLRLDAIDAALASLGVPALVTDGHGAVLHANEAALSLDPVRNGFASGSDPHRLLRLPPGPVRDRVSRLLAAAARGEAGGACRMAGLLASVLPLPLPLARLCGAASGRVLVTFRPLEPPRDLAARAAAAFGLTTAEAAVAARLAAGDSPAEIAAARGVKISTVRSLLDRAQDKTDSRNLRDLLRVLLALDR